MADFLNRITFAKKLYIAAFLVMSLVAVSVFAGAFTGYRVVAAAVTDGAQAMGAEQLRALIAHNADAQHKIVSAAMWQAGVQVGVEAVLILFILSVLKATLSDPAARLADVTTTLARGGDAEVPFQDRGDEVGALAVAVESFREAAQQRRDEDAARAIEQKLVTESLAQGLAALSRGDLACEIRVDFPAHYAALKTDFNAAVATLARLMDSVIATSAAVRNGAGEMSSAAVDLSQRTEQQAATLEEAAASVRELTSSVSESAQHAAQASASARAAMEDAQTSGVVVRDAIAAMTSIARSSELMGNVVNLIDGIAFQTNLLALNAGVEAARAGSVGAGFAVVANEVRSLSQRATEAAKEIGALITQSGRDVATGVQLVNKAGEALERIEASAVQVSGLIGQIADASQNQAGTIQHVNTTVGSMDRATQLNAALVEETTAASQSLAGQADRLSELVGRFHLAPGRPAGVPIDRPLRLAS